MESEKVSVIIPCYNYQDYIVKAVNSVIHQTYQQVEIIIINDGSTDNSLEVIKEIINSHPDKEIKLIDKKNEGISAARNDGVRIATGKYIVYLDSDDWLDRDFVEVMVREAEKSGSDVVMSGNRKVMLENGREKVVETVSFANDQKTILRFSIWAKIYKKEYLESIEAEFAVGKEYEDNPYSMKVMFSTDRIRTIDYVGYNNRKHENSLTTKKIENEVLPYDDFRKVIHYIYRVQRKNPDIGYAEVNILSYFIFFQFSMLRKNKYFKLKNRKADLSTSLSFAKFCQDEVVKYGMGNNQYLKIFKRSFVKLHEKVAIRLYLFACRHHLLLPIVRMGQ